MRICSHLSSFLLLLLPVFIFGQKISGRVINEGGRPASHVRVQFRDNPVSVLTNTDGRFTINAKKLPDTIFLSSAGYEPYSVLVTRETVSDSTFEIVLLSTRSKAAVSDDGGTGSRTYKIPINSDTTGKKAGSKGKALADSVNYISGKKLVMLDSTVVKKGAVLYKAGLLMAGEINDFDKWNLWEDFHEKEFQNFGDHWKFFPKHRYTVQVENKEHHAIIGQPVHLINKKTRDTVWSAITDNTGKAELWPDLKDLKNSTEYTVVSKGAREIEQPVPFENGINKMEVNAACSTSNTVDIAIAVDATGSMSDEIDFLKIELEDVIRNTFAEHADLDLHVASVFYRDKGDEYLVRHVNFQTDLLKVLNFIKLQRAGGGGDVPEAVDLALQTALDSLRWNAEARTRILFLVLDAPPHDESKEKIFQLTSKAAAKGIRLVPVVCSGADKSTEYIMRSMALATNGSYVFLADDNAPGFSLNKSNGSVFNIEFFSSLLERIIKQMVFAPKCGEQVEAETFKNLSTNRESISISPNPAKGTITIECKNQLKEIFITDFTGKMLMRITSNEKLRKWTANLDAFPDATYYVKYRTMGDEWGSEKFVLVH